MENNNKSSLPIAIIGLVAIVAIGLGAWFYLGSKKEPVKSSNTSSAPKTPGIPPGAPAGASPAWSKGSPSAVVTIEEFADFQCPTCAGMHPKVQEVRSTFGDRVRIIFRQFPLEGHRWGYDAACAAEAAGAQGKFWEMQNMLFTSQQSWTNATDARAVFTEYAKTLGLNVEQFSNDIISLPIKNRVDADLQRGRAAGVSSTPSFYINNKPLGTNLDALRSTVEKALQDAEGAKQAPPSDANASNANSNK